MVHQSTGWFIKSALVSAAHCCDSLITFHPQSGFKLCAWLVEFTMYKVLRVVISQRKVITDCLFLITYTFILINLVSNSNRQLFLMSKIWLTHCTNPAKVQTDKIVNGLKRYQKKKYNFEDYKTIIGLRAYI